MPAAWDALLGPLAETPRENGSAALHQTARLLFDLLHAAGLEVEAIPFVAHPYALRLAGVIALFGGLAYLGAIRARRGGLALAIALALPALLLAELSWYVPVFGWVGAETEHHVLARVRPEGEPVQRLILAAHYDTKTDLLDHVERAPIELASPALIALLVAGALALATAPRRRFARGLARVAGWGGAAWGVGLFAALSAGAFVPARSPGALDDGGACAVLVRLAERLASEGSLERTEVELLWLAAEEVGVQGSWAYAAQRFASPPDVPTWVINLEGIGASLEIGAAGLERFVLTSHAADPRLVDLVAGVVRARAGREMEVTRVGGATDARSFLAHGVPAVTLFSREPGARFPRGLHSRRDDRSRLDESALDGTLDLLAAVVRAADREPLR
jgi:acetylornithine deacetylase/succinyl-diaminopimelate desuccinylase-like protein